ncbi:MAG: glycosyltransferase [Bdellovibrionia bacterium]
MPKALFIGYIWPEPQSSAAGLRTYNLLNTLRKNPWEILFTSAAKENDHTRSLHEHGIQTQCIRTNDSSFDQLLTEVQPDFVFFDRFISEEQFGWRVQDACPHAVRIIDTQDLHFLRRIRQRELKKQAPLEQLTQARFEFHEESVFREIASLFRSDCSLIISSFERDLLKNRFHVPDALLHLHRFQYPEMKPTLPFKNRIHFAMIGNFRHAPNFDGVFWLKKELWPAIRKRLPQAQVHLYGAYPPQEIMALHDPKTGFLIPGFTPDQHQTLAQYRVNLAPLRFGAGIKGKITDGWWSGTPVVTTSLGAQGMADGLPWGGAISDDPEDFATKAVELHESLPDWQRAQQAGSEILRQLYSEEPQASFLMQRLLKIQNNLNQHRRDNFTGAMLTYHLQRSDKYFSRWIEAKNRPSLIPD